MIPELAAMLDTLRAAAGAVGVVGAASLGVHGLVRALRSVERSLPPYSSERAKAARVAAEAEALRSKVDAGMWGRR